MSDFLTASYFALTIVVAVLALYQSLVQLPRMDDITSTPAKTQRAIKITAPDELVREARAAFLIYRPDELLGEIEKLTVGPSFSTAFVRDAYSGLQGVMSAGTLPFALIYDAVQQRRFDRMLSAERIRSLKDAPPTGSLTEELEQRALNRTRHHAAAVFNSDEGSTALADSVVYELNKALKTPSLNSAARELLVQSLIATWCVFENFASSFIIEWINKNPKCAKRVLSSAELKAYFGKPVIDIDAIDEHNFDLSRSMGNIIFRGKRLDNLSIIRCIFEVLFGCPQIRTALGDELWLLNQRRHLFVHRRGLVDQEYISRTNDEAAFGKPLKIESLDIERFVTAVTFAIRDIAQAANLLVVEDVHDIFKPPQN